MSTRTQLPLDRTGSRFAACTVGGGGCKEEVVNALLLWKKCIDRVRLSDQVNKCLLNDCYEDSTRLNPEGWERRE